MWQYLEICYNIVTHISSEVVHADQMERDTLF